MQDARCKMQAAWGFCTNDLPLNINDGMTAFIKVKHCPVPSRCHKKR